LSQNSNNDAIQLLRENTNKIDWYFLSTNPSIFKKDQQFHKMQFEIYK
jgi:hypothetical protein